MTATAACAFDWCCEKRPHHAEHTWTDGVTGSGSGGQVRRAYVWTSLQDGYDDPILIGVQNSDDDSCGGELWLSLEGAEYLRDALTAAIEHAR
ncbi:MAG TPA: hypothetical protein VIQ11_21905, partial [Mycobacterium sp.]